MSKVELTAVLDLMKQVYEESMPFNKLLGIKIDSLQLESVALRLSMRDELVGNFEKKILHGGVISSVLDFAGGVVAQVHVVKEMEGVSSEELLGRLTRMSTIDMRVDFISPGRGEEFIASGDLLRLGNKVAVVRTQLHNETGRLIAAATGSYHVS